MNNFADSGWNMKQDPMNPRAEVWSRLLDGICHSVTSIYFSFQI